MNYYEVLGVSSSASTDEITSAYHRLALQFHPDRHPAASDAERLQFQDGMARINDAYSVLQDPTKRQSYDREQAPQPGSTPLAHPPTARQCVLCGYEPADAFSFRYQHSFLFRRVVYTRGGHFCAECAQSIGRAAQSRTLAAGWWGMISIFLNPFYALGNTAMLFRAWKLNPGNRSDPLVVAPLNGPLPPGRPVFARLGFAVFLALVVAVALAAVSSSGTQPSGASSPSSSAVPWASGNCVDGVADLVHPVDCSQSHIGRIVAAESVQSLCPSETTKFVQYATLYYCIVETTN